LLFPAAEVQYIPASKNTFVAPAIPIRTGDIVLRNGKGWISDFFRNTSRLKKEYSHAGIIMVEGKEIMVAHMIGDGVTSGFRKESLAKFCSSEKNSAYAVFRYEELSEKEQLIRDFLTQTGSRKIPFDDRFDLSTDSAMYCTELVYEACKAAGYTLNHSGYKGRDFISLDDLYTRNQATLIIEHHY
jgi:hypothetical protein